MTADEAIVLIIRERAMLVDEPNSALYPFNGNNSFVSKYSFEMFDALNESKIMINDKMMNEED